MPEDNGDQQNVQTPADNVPGSTQGTQTNGEQTNATPASGQPSTQKWMSQLPDELKGNENLSQYSSLGEALKGLLDGSNDTTKNSGTQTPSTKGKDQNPQGSEIKYSFTKQFSKEADSDGTLQKKLTETLKSMNLPQDQAEPIFNAIVDYQNGNIETFMTQGKQLCEQALKERWGDKYDAKVSSMQRAYGQLVKSGSELEKGLKATQAENNPFVAELLSTIGESISEHTPPNRSTVGAEKQSGGFLSRENEKYPWAN